MSSPPTYDATLLEVSGRWDALFEPDARVKLERILSGYVAARRWFRTKTKRISGTRIVAAFVVPLGRGGVNDARVTLVEVSLDDGARDTYVLPLTFVAGEEADRLRARRPDALVTPLRLTRGEAQATSGIVVDALAAEDFLMAWLDAIARGGAIEDAGLVLRFHPLAELERAANESDRGRCGVEPKAASGEQTNTSIVYGDRFVAKVLRRLDPGESPDLEVGRILTAAGYARAPRLGGWVDVVAADGVDVIPSTLGLVHTFVPSRGDAWRSVLEALDGWLGAAAERDEAPPRLEDELLARAEAPLSPEAAAATGEHAELAARLGRRVGEMHVALASATGDPRFSPEPLDVAARTHVARAVMTDLDRALRHAEREAHAIGAGARGAFAAVRARQRALDARLEAAVRLGEGAICARVHGDLHLGQVLFTGDDFVILDFEGEPARTLEERKSKRSPLVDVAGMLRSYHYAIVTATRARPEATRAAIAPWAALWYRAATASFLRGWLGAVEGTIVLPPTRVVTGALLDLFLLEKGVYEVGYELDSRPDWVEIPLQGICELLDGAAPGVDPPTSKW